MIALGKGISPRARLAALSLESRQQLAAMLLVITGGDLPSDVVPAGSLADAEAAGLVMRDPLYEHPVMARELPDGHHAYLLTPHFVEVVAALLVCEPGMPEREGMPHGATC